tara:strand:+ start:539 stop:1411 length:873 start_codon:yes stop_codon:yes gene_type:complete
MNKLSLGTVQFGLNYGISNKGGKVKVEEVRKILELAKNSNIDLIDTAISYGDCEKVIGDIGIKEFQVISKLPDFPKDNIDVDTWVDENVKSSIKRLGINSLYGLLIHKTENLLNINGKKLINSLDRIKKEGLVQKIGISIYDPSECERIFNLMRIDIVQAPLNIVDRRLEKSGWLSKLNSEQVEIHTRSVFLQGLLLMSREAIPVYFNKWSKIWDQWSFELKKKNLNPIEVCLSYILSLPEVDHIIVGVDNVYQLKDIIEKSKSKVDPKNWSFMVSNDKMLIDPTNWYKL